MIEIKMLTDAAFKTLQKNVEDVTKNIINHPSDSTWLKSYLGFEPYETKKYEIEDFDFFDDVSEEGQFKNALILYDCLHNLPKYIICDNKFWGWIIFEKGYKLAQKLMKVDSGIVSSRWLANTARRSLMLNVIGRMYFKVEISVDETKDDKYELTKYVFTHHNIYKNLAFRNIGMLKNVSLAVLKVHKEVHEMYPDVSFGDDVDSPLLNEASKIGSVRLIDTLIMDEIYSLLKPKFIAIVENKINKN